MTVPLCVLLLFSALGPSAAAASTRVGFNDNTPFIEPSFISDAGLASTLRSSEEAMSTKKFGWNAHSANGGAWSVDDNTS